MDFAELEAIEGLRWSWNSWPSSPSAAAADLVVPLAVLCTLLSPNRDIPLLPYDPHAVLNPYARVDYRSAVWSCPLCQRKNPLCQRKNPFPHSYAGIGENNLLAELFPTYSTVEYNLSRQAAAAPVVHATPRPASNSNFFNGGSVFPSPAGRPSPSPSSLSLGSPFSSTSSLSGSDAGSGGRGGIWVGARFYVRGGHFLAGGGAPGA